MGDLVVRVELLFRRHPHRRISYWAVARNLRAHPLAPERWVGAPVNPDLLHFDLRGLRPGDPGFAYECDVSGEPAEYQQPPDAAAWYDLDSGCNNAACSGTRARECTYRCCKACCPGPCERHDKAHNGNYNDPLRDGFDSESASGDETEAEAEPPAPEAVPPAPAPEAEPPAPMPSQGPACAEPPAPADGDDDEPAWLRSAASDVGLASPPSTPPRTLSRADKAEEEEDARASPRTDTRAGGRRRSGRRGSGNRRSA